MLGHARAATPSATLAHMVSGHEWEQALLVPVSVVLPALSWSKPTTKASTALQDSRTALSQGRGPLCIAQPVLEARYPCGAPQMTAEPVQRAAQPAGSELVITTKMVLPPSKGACLQARASSLSAREHTLSGSDFGWVGPPNLGALLGAATQSGRDFAARLPNLGAICRVPTQPGPDISRGYPTCENLRNAAAQIGCAHQNFAQIG